MTRRDLIVELARTLRDVQGTEHVAAGHSGRPESRILQPSHLYHQGLYKHLEDALARMKFTGDPVRQWRWHFTSRYLASTRKALPARTRGSQLQVLIHDCWEPAKPSRGFREPLGGVYSDTQGHRVAMVELWHNHVQEPRVQDALAWLDRHMPARLWLPDWAEAA